MTFWLSILLTEITITMIHNYITSIQLVSPPLYSDLGQIHETPEQTHTGQFQSLRGFIVILCYIQVQINTKINV